ncbi:MAG: dihydroorotase [candidate division NC10 bacterium RIFCSPLOWO2_12_FULL_66_18]|nr:MAG: dihydroorotase [candidate division NC10 bacterium RIFCSPLOWO2_12_FULL_66_18]
MSYDTILRGGRVLDPIQGRETLADVGISGSTIAAIAPRLAASPTTTVHDVNGAMVVPGLVDFHAHVFEGVCQIGLTPDRVGVQTGVTTVVDTGSSGAITFGGFRRWLMEPATTRVLCFLNMGVTGIIRTVLGEMSEEGCYDPELTAKVLNENRDRIVGIKVRATARNLGRVGLEGLRRAKRLARDLGVPVLVHIGEGRDFTGMPSFTAGEVLDLLDAGDILTHPFTARMGGVLQADGTITPALWAAVKRGVHFDVGHGKNNFSCRVYQILTDLGFREFLIGTDVNTGCVHGPVFDMATTMTKFLALGLAPGDIVRRVTTLPAKALGREKDLGCVQVGGEADLTVLDLDAVEKVLQDSEGEAIPVRQEFRPRLVVRAGRVLSVAPGGVQGERA